MQANRTIKKRCFRFFLILCVFVLLHNGFGAITDSLNSTLYLTPSPDSSINANGNSTVSMTITTAGDPFINWYDCCYVRFRDYNDKVEIQPSASIGSGQYSLYILFFDSSKNLLAEIKWGDTTADTDIQTLRSVSQLAAENNISGVEYYWIRFRLNGTVGDGFIFDEIRIKEGAGYWQPTPLTTAATKAVFAHEMTGFRTVEYSGYWSGWNSNSHNPAITDVDGKPDIASVYYPSVGYYDMKDPDLVEYHCQSLKMAGIDGVIFDLGFYDMDAETVNMISNYLNTMAAYNLQAVICYEDKAHWLWDASATTRAMAVQRAYDDMNHWLTLFNTSGRQYYVTGTRPLFLLFSYEFEISGKGTSCLLPTELTTWLNTFDPANRPVLMRQWYKDPDHIGVLNGMFGWPQLYPAPPELAPYVGYCDMAENESTLTIDRSFGQYLFDNGYADFHIPGVWPGFDDYAVWGWGDGPRLMPRYNGQLYDMTWDYAIDDNLPVVQIATWNDWFEATIIEPSVEFGNLYLEKTLINSAVFKNISDPPMPNFNVPIWIYKIGDITTDPLVLDEMNTASAHIAAGEFELAEQIVLPWANYFAIDSVVYWTGAGSITTAPDIQVEPSLSMGSVPVGSSKVAAVVIENIGTDVLKFLGSTPISIVSGSDNFSFNEAVYSGDLSIGQTRSVMIKFEPQTTGTKTGILRITTNDPDNPVVDITLAGDAAMAGDYYPDGHIDMNDFCVIAQGWGNQYALIDLQAIAINWLSGE